MKKYSVPPLLQAVLGWVRKKPKALVKIEIVLPNLNGFLNLFREVYERW